MGSPFRMVYVKVRSGDDTFLEDHDCTEDSPNYAKISQSILQYEEMKIDFFYTSSEEHRNLWLRQTCMHQNKILQECVTLLEPVVAGSTNQHSIAHVLAPGCPHFAEDVYLLTEIYSGNSLLCEFVLILANADQI
ncbi:hypothetical protein Zmor_016068 [Zophobas morio]|uniref:Uncharacterized protein n=1 Tax=Zophobas morio TaxID=2755281 RepID=A0AA38IL12_9CUCU|nr:hypothetical protein Zmor_016068 [Zophobas morio]